MKQPLGFSFVVWLFDDMDKYYCKLYLWKKKKILKTVPKEKSGYQTNNYHPGLFISLR